MKHLAKWLSWWKVLQQEHGHLCVQTSRISERRYPSDMDVAFGGFKRFPLPKRIHVHSMLRSMHSFDECYGMLLPIRHSQLLLSVSVKSCTHLLLLVCQGIPKALVWEL